MLTILLKECRRRIAWPYSRVLWPPPCAAWGKEEENVSTGQWWPLWEQSSTRILDDKLQRKDALQSSQGIHSRSKWPAYGRGDLWPQPCSIFGRRCVGSDLFSKMAPAWNQQKPTAVLPGKHGNEIGTAYLPLKLLRSIQSEREKQMWCNYSQATEKLLGQAQGHILCLVVFPFKALPPTHLNGSYLPSSHQPEMALNRDFGQVMQKQALQLRGHLGTFAAVPGSSIWLFTQRWPNQEKREAQEKRQPP